MSFDVLARPYIWLERLAFGWDLERARFCHIDALGSCRRILVLGEGDGRFLSRLLARFPSVDIDCVDSSAAMLELARRRLTDEQAKRVTFRCEDALASDWRGGPYDAVVTLFFLDCFSTEELDRLLPRIAGSLTATGLWVWADFRMPERGWRRYRAKVWLGFLYGFFRTFTHLTARVIPPAEAMIERIGLDPSDIRSYQAEMIRSIVFRRGAAADGSSPL